MPWWEHITSLLCKGPVSVYMCMADEQWGYFFMTFLSHLYSKVCSFNFRSGLIDVTWDLFEKPNSSCLRMNLPHLGRICYILEHFKTGWHSLNWSSKAFFYVSPLFSHTDWSILCEEKGWSWSSGNLCKQSFCWKAIQSTVWKWVISNKDSINTLLFPSLRVERELEKTFHSKKCGVFFYF